MDRFLYFWGKTGFFSRWSGHDTIAAREDGTHPKMTPIRNQGGTLRIGRIGCSDVEQFTNVHRQIFEQSRSSCRNQKIGCEQLAPISPRPGHVSFGETGSDCR